MVRARDAVAAPPCLDHRRANVANATPGAGRGEGRHEASGKSLARSDNREAWSPSFIARLHSLFQRCRLDAIEAGMFGRDFDIGSMAPSLWETMN
jgi:hypothetical protein